MTRAARSVTAYLRCSTEEQAREGLGLAAQESQIRAYCAAHGLTLAEMVTDSGVSGKSLDRPELIRLLDRIRAGEVGTVIVARLDRLTRKTRDLLALVEDVFRAHRVELVSLAEKLDTASPAGMLMLTLLGALAQMERELIGERTRAALAVKKERGERLGGLPLGFQAGAPGGTLEPLESEIGAVQHILTRRAAGVAYRTIAEELQAAGVPTKKGGRWRSETIRKIVLRRQSYLRYLS